LAATPELLEYAPETRSGAFVCRTIGEFELSNDVDGHEGFSHLRLWMSSGRCRWALIYLAFGTLTSINNFAAVTASKAGKEGTLKKIKKVPHSDALPDAAGDCDYCRYRERSARNYVPYKHKEHS